MYSLLWRSVQSIPEVAWSPVSSGPPQLMGYSLCTPLHYPLCGCARCSFSGTSTFTRRLDTWSISTADLSSWNGYGLSLWSSSCVRQVVVGHRHSDICIPDGLQGVCKGSCRVIRSSCFCMSVSHQLAPWSHCITVCLVCYVWGMDHCTQLHGDQWQIVIRRCHLNPSLVQVSVW